MVSVHVPDVHREADGRLMGGRREADGKPTRIRCAHSYEHRHELQADHPSSLQASGAEQVV
jgi:hypothetical protein